MCVVMSVVMWMVMCGDVYDDTCGDVRCNVWFCVVMRGWVCGDVCGDSCGDVCDEACDDVCGDVW